MKLVPPHTRPSVRCSYTHTHLGSRSPLSMPHKSSSPSHSAQEAITAVHSQLTPIISSSFHFAASPGSQALLPSNRRRLRHVCLLRPHIPAYVKEHMHQLPRQRHEGPTPPRPSEALPSVAPRAKPMHSKDHWQLRTCLLLHWQELLRDELLTHSSSLPRQQPLLYIYLTQ